MFQHYGSALCSAATEICPFKVFKIHKVNVGVAEEIVSFIINIVTTIYYLGEHDTPHTITFQTTCPLRIDMKWGDKIIVSSNKTDHICKMGNVLFFHGNTSLQKDL